MGKLSKLTWFRFVSSEVMVTVPGLLLWPVLALEAQQYRGFWADAFHRGYKSPAEIDALIDNLTLARANAIFPEVRRSGGSYYLKSLEPPVEDSEYIQGFDARQYLIVSRWSSEQAFRDFVASDAFKKVTSWGAENILEGRPSHTVYH